MSAISAAAPSNSKATKASRGWKTVKLGDVADHVLGKMLDVAKNKGTPRPYLRNPNVKWFQIDLSETKLMLFEDDEIARFSLKNGDVVICEGGEAGRAAIWEGRDGEMMFQKAIHRVRPGPDLNNRYLVHRLRADFFSGKLADYYTGATIKHLTGQDLDRYEFELPPMDEQRRIVEILDAADALRQKRRQALRLLDQFSQSMFIEMFGDPVSNPKGWDDTRVLSDFADIASGITKGRRLNGDATREVPYLAVYNVQDKALRLDQVKTIEATEDEIVRYRLVQNDLLLTEGGDPDKLGRGTLWHNELPECIHQNHVFRARLNSADIDPLYLNWLVGSQRGKQYFLRSAKQTTGIASINMTQLRAFPMLLPPKKLQREFARRMSALKRTTEQANAHARALEEMFASLQHRAFSGEL